MTSHAIARTAATAVAGILTLTLGLPLLAMAGLAADGTPLHPEPAFASDGIPPIAADAYTRAATGARSFEPPCEVPAWLLAGVGYVESGHGTHRGATVATSGSVHPPIIGVPLPHLGPDTDDGRWDGSTSVDHAVGPMQFIPSTWRLHGRDGNDDGIADPHNIYDAALAAAAYLCTAGTPMADEADWRRALLVYNRSNDYVDEVLEAGARYRSEPPESNGDGSVRLVYVDGIGLTNESWAPQIRAMLAAARADGLTLTGHSYRDPAQQIALRRAHCGTSTYAIYEMPANHCRPPTARPGTSLHEQGLAIDFNQCSTRSSACHRWLATHAHAYGLRPLHTEPWHWSATGA